MGLVLVLAAVGLFCVLLFRFAIYALPAAIGVSVGYWAVTTGAGVVGGILAGIVAGVFVFVLGQVVFTSSRSALVRGIVAAIFIIPAMWAGYSLVLQLSEAAGTTSPLWRHVFAAIGGAVIGWVSFTRLATPNSASQSPSDGN
jgi:fructose-specific phosphotransferase system IIC component